jgi:tetratricopeptide (TPR) repeat protein
MKSSFISYCLLLILFAFNYAFAQEMSPEAASLYNEGNKLAKDGDFNNAIVKYDSALNIEKDFRIYYQKGAAYRKAGNLDSAKIAFDESIKLKPDFEGSYNALGSVYFAMKNYQEAALNFEKVLQMSTDTTVKSSVKENLGVAYTMLGNEAISDKNNTKALEYLQKAVENKTYDKAYILLARVYSELGDFDKTLAAADSALKFKSTISEGGPYYYMGLAYKGKGDLNKAKEMFTQAKGDVAYKKAAEYELSLLK